MFQLGRLSLVNLGGVHPDLSRLVKTAINMSEVDFRVIEGLRTLERQKQLVASGASQTLKSRHLTGHAVDLAALVDGRIEWAWPLYYKIADAMKNASKILNIPVEWGVIWDKELSQCGDLDEEVEMYSSRMRALGKKPFLDGPHFQLPWHDYP